MRVSVDPDNVVTRSADGRCRISLSELIKPGETVEIAVLNRGEGDE